MRRRVPITAYGQASSDLPGMPALTQRASSCRATSEWSRKTISVMVIDFSTAFAGLPAASEDRRTSWEDSSRSETAPQRGERAAVDARIHAEGSREGG
jgi:hypothetical protein